MAGVETWLWIGVIGMFIGWVALYFPLASNKTEKQEADLMAHFYVPLIAFTLYLLMALGGGIMTTAAGRTFYYGRYIDWSITTPLLLFSLVSSGLLGTGIKRPALLVGLLGADLYMIVTGFAAALTDNPSIKWSFYVCSWFGFIAIYALLLGPYKRLIATGPHAADYGKKLAVLGGLWFLYPIVFLLGQEGLRIWSPLWDAVFFTVLDITAKVVYGIWAVSLAKKASASLPVDYSTARTATVR